MNSKNVTRLLLMLLVLLSHLSARSGRVTDVYTFKIHFPLGESRVDPTLADNAAVIDSLEATFQRVLNDDAVRLDSVAVIGSASPEGNQALNERLCAARAGQLIQMMHQHGLDADCPVNVQNTGSNLAEYQALSAGGDSSSQSIYPKLRYAYASIYGSREIPEPVAVEPEPQSSINLPETAIAVEEEEVPSDSIAAPSSEKVRRWRVKTNAVGWGLLVANAAVEFDFAKHWSVALPIYYSGVNFFNIKTKFRTFTVQPEVRYWFAGDHAGFFAAAHLGVGYFNFATGKDFRIQDHRGTHPAYGGGIAAGWRMNLSRNHRWQLEFTAGVGAYRANYDKFENRLNGPLVEEGIHKTFFGVDQAAATFIFIF